MWPGQGLYRGPEPDAAGGHEIREHRQAVLRRQGRDIDIIQLNGSIELAPILGLSDVIVDIVETGTTLRENDLKVLTEFMPISAGSSPTGASYQFKHREIEALLKKLTEVTEA